jgi:hypothetical protein
VVNSSGEILKARDSNLARQIQQLSRCTIAVLRIKYREVLGQEAPIQHKHFLVRRIAWQLQAQAQGDLSERARRRIAEIADGAELTHPSKVPKPLTIGTLQASTQPQRDPRLPAPGTLLRRRYQGREIVVKVLANGFECDSERYSSLSALARQLTGTRWNGLLFFGLTERRDG